MENKLREVTDVRCGGAVPVADMLFFEKIDDKQGCVYYCGSINGTDGKYKIIVFGTKVNSTEA